MNSTHTLNRNFEVIIWGALFVWWGVILLFDSLPEGTGLTGTGLILVGLNAARRLNGISVSGFYTTLGVLALVWGGLLLAAVVLPLPSEPPIFAILLITLGVLLLAPWNRAPEGEKDFSWTHKNNPNESTGK